MPTPHPKLRVLQRAALVFCAAALVTAAWGLFERHYSYARLTADTEQAMAPFVKVVRAVPGGQLPELVLPGTVKAFASAPIYARTSGYLKSWHADIGAHVKKGQLLAELEAPDLDAQYRQAQADAGTAEANSRTSHLTAARYQSLRKQGLVSQQDADTTQGDADAKQAQLESARANLARLVELESFKRILAPFDGIVTARGVDVGALVNAASGQELFHMESTGALRVYVQVPQAFAGQVTPGQQAQLTFPERAGHRYPAQVTTTARALDPATRTLLTELRLANSSGEVLAGSYGEVHFRLPDGPATLRLPSNTLLFRADGQYVATTDAHGTVQLHKVQLGRDFGNEMEILGGVQANDAVITNPPDSIQAGAQVRVLPAAAH
jgi:RND family efflux transporter MFP subunit